jgi:hypothetical protein
MQTVKRRRQYSKVQGNYTGEQGEREKNLEILIVTTGRNIITVLTVREN